LQTMSFTTPEQENIWDAKAASHEHGFRIEEFVISAVANELTFHLANLEPKDEVLDVAAGCGNCRYFPDGFDMERVTNFDNSSEMLRFTHLRGFRHGSLIHGNADEDLRRGGLILGDTEEEVEIGTSRFSLVLCIFGMRYFHNQLEVIHRMVEAAKPGATVLIMDLCPPFEYHFSVDDFRPDSLVDQMLDSPVESASSEIRPIADKGVQRLNKFIISLPTF
jgi:SAM-dependent methyltransferase